MGAARSRDASPQMERARAAEVFARLRLSLRDEGLFIVLPLVADAFDAVCLPSAGPSAAELLPHIGTLMLVGDGGPTFFQRFQASRVVTAEGDNPLDDYTRSRIASVVERVLHPEGIPYAIRHPFGDEGGRPLPFQRLGCAAGLAAPGPLGLQIHPVYGPWWAYRALVATTLPHDEAVEEFAPFCPRCEQPCVTGCAVHPSVARGTATTPVGEATCGDGCGARGRCPVGVEHRYSMAQVAFHARAREVMTAAWAATRPR